jgi:hypothetical protein
VAEARQRQLGGARAAADLRLGLEYLDLDAGLCENDRGDEPIRPGTDDDGLRYSSGKSPSR